MEQERIVPLVDRVFASPWSKRARQVLLAIVLLGGAWQFGSVVSAHYPIRYWLFWYYAKYWLLLAWWSVSVLSFGHLVVTKVLQSGMHIGERLVLSFAVGLFAFFLAMVVGGLLGLYGVVFFVVLPTLMLVIGLRCSWRYARRLIGHARYIRKRFACATPWRSYVLLGCGLVGLLLVYLPVLVPNNVSFDARWYHLPIAEHYAASHGVIRFPEGWFLGAYPHLASYLYCWAFQLPMSTLFDRVELSAHLEFVLFLWTLAMIPALVRRVVPRARARHAWVALFLFPGVFLYDSSLSAGADHIAAFWAVPVVLAFLHAWRALSARWCLLLGVFAAGAMNTKYTAFSLVVFPAFGLVVRCVMASVSAIRHRGIFPSLRQAWFGPLTAAIAGVLLTSPHWAKNWIWYGDPLYPNLQKYFSLRPWSADAATRLQQWQATAWHPTRDWAGLKETLEALYSFSFVPHDWAEMHGLIPVFGSLFTLTAICLPFLKGASGRLWALFLSGHVGVFGWYWIQHEDRYLQVLVPWMASAVAAVAVLLWRSGLVGRLGMLGLFGLQVVWGADAIVIAGHLMMGQSAIKSVVDFLSLGYEKRYEERFQISHAFSEVGAAVPRSARVLVHEERGHLGIRVATIQDWGGTQGGIDYGALNSPAEVYDLLARMNATHVLWTGSQLSDSIAGDLVFYDFVIRHTIERKNISPYFVGKLPAVAPPSEPFGDIVVFLGCSEHYTPGLYHRRDLTVFPFDPRPDSEYPRPFEPATPETKREGLLSRADFVVLNPACAPRLEVYLASDFVGLTTRGNLQLWVRRTSP